MNTGVILETETDKQAEQITIERLTKVLPQPVSIYPLPALSRVDYFIGRHDSLTAAIEVKNRKQDAKYVRQYGGLMLKHRKIDELRQLSQMLQLPVYLVFGFGGGYGEIHLAEPDNLTHLQPQTPPTRRNYRGLACDNEPVVYLDWATDLRRVV
jgi:hypothetical protein